MSEAPRKRRLPIRALTLAEVVGILAVLIAALGYWDSHRERVQSERERAAAEKEHQAEAKATAKKPVFLMSGQAQGGDLIRLASVHPDQVIQTQAVSFPSDVRADAVQTTGNPRIEAGWLEDGLEKAMKARGVKAERGRVPVGVATTFIEDGQEKTDRSIYVVGYSLHPRMLRSARIELEGLSRLQSGVGGDLQKAVDATWERMAPRPPAKAG
jgi:hypothetical protein